VDPDQDTNPDPAVFVTGLQKAKNKTIFSKVFCFIILEGKKERRKKEYLYIFYAQTAFFKMSHIYE
jgi:hypothetical protein